MLETQETSRVNRQASEASSYATSRRRAQAPTLRRDAAEDFARHDREFDLGEETDAVAEEKALAARRRRRAVKQAPRGGMPRSTVGRVVFGTSVVALLGVSAFALWQAKTALLRDSRFTIASSESIQIAGNSHVTRAQLLSVFGEDVDHNILTVSLSERRAELERMPWVEHATVMRLLPNHIRVAIVERTPVAFYRDNGHEGSKIGLVDANGVLLDMPDAADETPAPHYSFPVVTGIGEDEPLSTRAARMKIFQRFTSDLNGADLNAPKGDRISDRLSEVDLSSPEDVRALIPTGAAGAAAHDVLVHFGDEDFLARYRRFEENLPKWLQEYPKLASADMRYPRQVVLEMTPGTQVPLAGDEPVEVNPSNNASPAPVKAAAKKVPEAKTSKTPGKGKPAAAKKATPAQPAAAAAPRVVVVTNGQKKPSAAIPKETSQN